MKKLNFLFWSIAVLVLICPGLSLSQVTYVMDASAPYSYVSGTNPVTSWVGRDPNYPADDGYFDLSLGDFAFQFYGVPVTTLRISTNGYMTFGTQGWEFANYPIPYSTPPNALIAPFWTDFDLSVSGQVRWGISGASPSRQLVVEWFEVPPFGTGSGLPYSFEAILYESTNEIKFQYSNVPGGIFLSTVGVENFDGTSGSQFSYNTSSVSTGLAIEFIPGITAVPGVLDFDGDGNTDMVIYRTGTGVWYIHPSGGGSPYGVGWGGDATDKPTSADYDSDGITDVSIYRTGTGAWYVIPSSGAAPYAVGWGGDAADKPVPGDYDGDGNADLSVYRGGLWFIYPSGGGSPYVVQWGDAADKPVPGDYDGDGKTDLSVYREGRWFIYPSGGGSPYIVEWGAAADKPVPGDYDGDGKIDIAVYRLGTGDWYIVPSGGGSPYGVGWGGDPSDVPVTINPASSYM